MFNKVKSAFYNVVGSFDPTEGGTIGNIGTVSLASGVQSISSVTRQNIIQGKEKTHKFPYTRPHFLQFSSEDEILVTADHAIRPIICPRDISRQPWNSGYAETINAGKSKKNEDQAAVHVGLLTRCVSRYVTKIKSNSKERNISQSVNGIDDTLKINESKITNQKEKDVIDNSNSISKSVLLNFENTVKKSISSKLLQETAEEHQFIVSLPYYYFGVFDGHAGWGAAVSAANQLQQIIHEKLCDVIEYIIPDIKPNKSSNPEICGPLCSMDKNISPESVIIGALEQAFWTMDQVIAEDRLKHQLSGGCTACIALFILGKVFVSNAGDSRAVIGLNEVPIPMSFDFTPETETQRIRKIGAGHPELLGGEFSHLEYLRRPLKRDLGRKALYRDHYMKGWALKTITEDDLKYPLVCGEGKRSRVLATIGVTRGFGDHDLKAQFSSLPIKPFLSPEPEVRVFDLSEVAVSDEDVLILGTDGLWDIVSNEKAVTVVTNSLKQFLPGDAHRSKYRYTSAAHDLVLYARGRLKDHNWRTGEDKHATIDDISVFVIPLRPYKDEFDQWQREANVAILEACETGVEASTSECIEGTIKLLNPIPSNDVKTNASNKHIVALPEHTNTSTSKDLESASVVSLTSTIPEVKLIIADQVSIETLISTENAIGNSCLTSTSSVINSNTDSSLNSTLNSSEIKSESDISLNPVDDYYEDCKNGN